MLMLRQNTAVTVKVGPFLDSTDGNSVEGSLTITQAEVRLAKNGGNIAQKNESSSLTHDELGWYDCDLDATDTNTLGVLQLIVHESGALQVWHEYMVVPSNVWDSLYGSDKLQVDAVEISSSTTAADNVEANIGNLDDSVADIQTDVTTILADTNELQTDWANGGRLDLILDATATQTSVDGLNDISPAEVNSEVVDALATDTYAEPGQGTPGATISLASKIGYLYKFLRNRVTVTGSEIDVYNDDATTVDHKSAHSDNGTTYDRGEFATGP